MDAIKTLEKMAAKYDAEIEAEIMAPITDIAKKNQLCDEKNAVEDALLAIKRIRGL